MKMIQRIFIVFILMTMFQFLHGQVHLSGIVIDSKSKTPVPYVYVFSNNSTCGTVTNEKGYFEMSCTDTDSIVISCLGYKTLDLYIGKSQKNLCIEISEDAIWMESITIYADDTYLYELIEKAKKN